MSSNTKPRKVQPPASATQELVDPLWMLKALGAVVVLAAACAYGAICALFWQGQWQIVLSPSRTVTATPSAVNLQHEDVRFGQGASGQPELSGWWIPAQHSGAPTVLMMHGGSRSMSDALSQARLLHDNHLNVFLFDYRGFGKSGGSHPTERRMEQDSQAALNYLINMRHLKAKEVIAFGEGVGASIATHLCTENRDISALILENADGDLETRAVLDARSRMVPVSLLFTQKFPLAGPLRALTTPKLLISYTRSATPPVDFARAGDPKLTVELDSPQNTAALSATLRRFLDTYVPAQPAILVPQTH